MTRANFARNAPWGHLVFPFSFLVLAAFTGCTRDSEIQHYHSVVTVNPDVGQEMQDFRETERNGVVIARPLAALRDSEGRRTLFINNELMAPVRTEAEARSILARIQAHLGAAPSEVEVVESDAVPLPPSTVEVTLTPQAWQRLSAPTSYLIRFPLARLDSITTSSFSAHMDHWFALREEGQPPIPQNVNIEASSDRGAKLLALVAALVAEGTVVTPNFVAESHSMLWSTREAGTEDAFLYNENSTGGSRSSMTSAWQLVRAITSLRTVSRSKVAVLDGGFWLNSAGAPMAGSDLPAALTQYDFDGDDYNAGGMNPSNCTGGGGCPWHGNGSAQTAAGAINNSQGGGSSGGILADPWVFKTNLDDSQVKRAVRTARAWGADVLSMSFGGNCDGVFCQIGRELNGYYGTFRDARNDSNLVMVASAGNDNGNNVNEKNVVPCMNQGVICVGALADDSFNRIGYSNRGSGVDLWAPTNIWVGPDGGSSGGNVNHNGTSASAPYVAGVAAILKALDPSLNSDGVNTILQMTAWTSGLGADVTAVLNAYQAILSVVDSRLPDDRHEPTNNDWAHPRTLTPGTYNDLAISTTSDRDYYRFVLADYARVDIQLDYMASSAAPQAGMGRVFMTVLPEATSGADFEGVTDVTTSDFRNRNWHADLMPPGTYRINLGGTGTPQLYNLRFTVAPVTLNPDAFEVNNSFSTAAIMNDGDYNVNFHVSGDVDYYRVTAKAGLPRLNYYAFDVFSSDRPLEITVFTTSGTEVGSTQFPNTTPGRSGQTASVSLEVPMGSTTQDYIIRVRALTAGRARYYVSTGMHIIPPPRFTPIRRFKWIDMGDPGPYWLSDPAEVIVFERTGQFRENTLDVIGEGLRVFLVDENNQVLQEGVRTEVRSDIANIVRTAEHLNLGGGAPTSGRAFIRIEREATPTASFEQPSEQEAVNSLLIPYSLRFR